MAGMIPRKAVTKIAGKKNPPVPLKIGRMKTRFTTLIAIEAA